jgi:hypothetical protein
MKVRAMRNFPLLLAAFVAWGQGGCGHGNRSVEEPRLNALVVCPNATEVFWKKSETTDQVSYRVLVAYPADSVLSCISKELSQKGWQALKEDFWNPGIPSSHVRGWTQFADTSVQPQANVDQWLGQWKNQTGDVLWYSLQYRYPPGDRNHLTVAAGFIPAGTANKIANGSKARN